MKNFDTFVGIDWSGAKEQRLGNIAVAFCPRGTTPPALLHPISGHKHWSRTDVGEWIGKLVGGKDRILIGIDCNFGYAEETGMRHFGKDYTYLDHWQAVDDANRDVPDYFAGKFWSHEKYKNDFWSETHRPETFTPAMRLTETTCIDCNYGRPESPFKLMYSKQVGKGGLAGMRLALALKKAHGKKISIWPFEQDGDDARIVITEIYPRQFIRRAGLGNPKVKDFEALNAALKAMGSKLLTKKPTGLTDHVSDALIAAAGLRLLCGNGRDIPEKIAHPPMLDKRRASREGWIFGAGDQ